MAEPGTHTAGGRQAGRRRGAPVCRHCRHFRNDADYLEAVLPGLQVMGSARASVRAEDGICVRHQLYLSARCSCAGFER
ncbi:MAG: hypothetical protein D6721_01205 [Gammaproteobacteria bacterium]|nr:MAG: hypothetical protein D6721_01205 [Gammaproteobacteria bacterium]